MGVILPATGLLIFAMDGSIDMREIKVGNILMYRKETVCVIFKIVAGDEDRPDIIMGIDHNNCICKGPAEDWSSVLHMKHNLRLFEKGIFNNIVVSRGI